MNSDNCSSGFGECSKAKKSKTESYSEPQWALLPSVVIHEIFDLLGRHDRQNASVTCWNWRRNLFHPKWWSEVTFKIEPNNPDKSQFFLAVFGRIAVKATVKFNTLGPECRYFFTELLDVFQENNNLRELFIEPSHCHFDLATQNNNSKYNTARNVIPKLMKIILNLEKFSIGCVENFSYYLDEYLRTMAAYRSEKVTLLGLASVKDNPNEYFDPNFDSALIKPFMNLKVLSIDFEQLSDSFLETLDYCERLERLIVHVHGIREDHPSTTNAAWAQFKSTHPQCGLRLTFIHSYGEILHIEETVLRKQMPLTHIKVFFCENVNTNFLDVLSSSDYAKTLRSIIWVDSLSFRRRSWSFYQPLYDDTPDPLIMISWQCKNLEELILYGYKYCDENLIAIVRLRGEKLKKLEMAEEDILSSNGGKACRLPREKYLMEIQSHLKRPWAPTRTEDLHPVIRNPTAGDSDEYLLPFVLADLR